jgi:hypothetical protein
MKIIFSRAGLILAYVVLNTACSDAQDLVTVEVVKHDLELMADSQLVKGTIYAKQLIQPATGDIFLLMWCLQI